MAVILNHPSHPVTFQPVTADELAAAIQAEEGYTPPSEEEWERLAAQEGLFRLIQRYGADRIVTWVRNLAAIAGHEVNTERPAHLCLACGAALHRNICVHCGRDNS